MIKHKIGFTYSRFIRQLVFLLYSWVGSGSSGLKLPNPMLIRITEKNKPNQIRKNVIVIFARAQLTPVLE